MFFEILAYLQFERL